MYTMLKTGWAYMGEGVVGYCLLSGGSTVTDSVSFLVPSVINIVVVTVCFI